MLFSSERVVTEVTELVRLREENGIFQRPLLVWEPLPGLCTANHLITHLSACRVVDVFSPNHLELLGLCGKPAIPFDKKLIEQCAQEIFEASNMSSKRTGTFPQAVVVRSGEHGCLVVSSEGGIWLPPYLMDSEKVVDATGGGNTFLGGFTIALQESGDLIRAAIYGSVAASFAIEQIGLPKRTGESGEEVWNGEGARKRLDSYGH
jgi:sugar/nucleoside kinase (ribokinase family)